MNTMDAEPTNKKINEPSKRHTKTDELTDRLMRVITMDLIRVNMGSKIKYPTINHCTY